MVEDLLEPALAGEERGTICILVEVSLLEQNPLAAEAASEQVGPSDVDRLSRLENAVRSIVSASLFSYAGFGFDFFCSCPQARPSPRSIRSGSSWGSYSSRFASNQAETEPGARLGSCARLDALLEFARLILANHARRRAMPRSHFLLNNQHQCHSLHSSEFTLSQEFNSDSNGRRLTARA
jgi:hypothetical protein